jgi:N-glycosidase YbiA
MTIRFYSTKDQYGEFSNFARYPFAVDGRERPTSEHYFQAQKFSDEEYREKILQTASPMIAARLGRSRKVPIRSDWEQIKIDIMRSAVRLKIAAHSELTQLPLGTGDEELIEAAPRDSFWGCGTDGTGSNWLGRILMDVREELKRNLKGNLP